MGRPHGPAQLRAFMRLLKDHQGSPEPLLEAIHEIDEPSQAARAYAALATAVPELRAQALEGARRNIAAITREAQVAEVVPEVIKHIDDPAWLELAQPLLRLPDGPALSQGIRAAAKVAPALRVPLFDRSVAHKGEETTDAKAVLRAAFTQKSDLPLADDWRLRIGQISDDDLRIRLHAFLHHQVSRLDPSHPAVMQTLQDILEGLRATPGDARRSDLWRTVAADANTLEPLMEVAEAESPAMQAEAFLAIGVQADRRQNAELAAAAFEAAQRAGQGDARFAARLEEARQRSGSKRARRATPAPAVPQRDLPPGKDRALALCNTYRGGVKEVHFRAVARAAALCAAFGLELVLLGFPAPLGDLVKRTARETRIGGEPWILRLHEADRVHEGPLEPRTYASLWGRYTWIATSERAEHPVALEDVAGPVCVVMGVGPQGLPRRLLHACHGEYEITGHGIGLETATAMGILADRLSRVAT